MSAAISTLREKLHQYIDHAEDKKVKAFYTIIETEIEDVKNDYVSAFKVELDKRYNDYKTGKTKMITPLESKKRIQKILKAKSSK
jgi:hypothetical protein